MGDRVEIRMIDFPDCWQSCGTCASDEVEVVELLIKAGQRLELYDLIMVWEASKTLQELTSPYAGRVLEVFVREGDLLSEGELILLLEPDG
jgi:pyruvate/2-oxoglutarate dehydrogenase complex dihydrolipoamide acyltransferase (E2) component